MPRIVTQQNLSQAASYFLLRMIRGGITPQSSLCEIEPYMNRSFAVNQKSRDRIETRIKGEEYVISYIIPGKGIVIEAKLNPMENCVGLVVKNNRNLEGYSPIIEDELRNKLQSKWVRGCSIGTLYSGLKDLESLA